MAGEELKLSFLLNGGIDDRSQAELRAPLIQQGASPNLAASINTRLSPVPGTVTRAPALTAVSGTGTAGVDCYGLLASDAGDAAVEFFLPGDEGAALGNRAIYGDGATSTAILRHQTLPASLQSVYVPTVVEPFISLTTPYGADLPEAVAYDVTNARIMRVATDAVSAAVYGYVVDTLGRVVVPLQLLFVDAAITWLGLTWHGANGFYVWYEDGTALRKRQVTVSGSLFTVGSETTVYTPAALGDRTDVCRVSDTIAAILGTSSASADDATLRSHNVTSGAETTAALSGVAAGTPTYYSVVCETIPSLAVQRIGVVCSTQTGTAVNTGVYDTTPTAIWGPTSEATFHGPVACRFQDSADGARLVYAVSDDSGSFSGAADTLRTQFRSRSIATGGAGPFVADVPWMVLANRGAQLAIGARLYPVFCLQRAYSGPAQASVSSPDFVDDPDIQVWLANEGVATMQVSPIARAGVVRSGASPARCAIDAKLAAGSAVGVGPSVYCSYLTESSGGLAAYEPRMAVISAVPQTLRSAHDKSGLAFAASALPVQWDGNELSEAGGPLYGPKLRGTVTGGSGASYAAGIYSFVAIYVWTDAAGMLHRSRVSNVVTMTLGGTDEPTLAVSLAASLRPEVRAEVYGTTANGITFHRIAAYPTSISTVVNFANLPEPLLESPQIYSTGEAGQEIMPQPPPPLHDVAIVGSRMWGIDAEIRSRAVHSKLRVSGVGFEWSPAMEVNFPSGGGDLQRVFEMQGVPVFVGSRATFYVTGEGPDNNGAGGFFSAPTKVSDHGCSNALAFGSFPGGAVWQDGLKWVVMRGMQTAYVAGVQCEFTPIAALHMRRSCEIVFVNPSGGAKVYNYEYDRWTTCDAAAVPVSTLGASVPYSDFTAYLYSRATGALLKWADATPSDSAVNMTLETDWMLLGGDWQDEVILRYIVFRANRAGPHALTVDVFTDYASSATTSRTWTNAELLSVADALGNYTIRIEPLEQASRAVKVRITDSTVGETDSEGMRPIALTVYYAAESPLREEAFALDAATK